MVLEEGATVSPFIMSNSDFEFLSSRVFQLQEVARIYRVPLHLIADLSNAHLSNIEEQSLDYVRYCLRPMAVRIESEFNKKLFNEAEKRRFFCKHQLDSIMRGEATARTAALKEQFLNGALTLNEWRQIEGRNPVEDPTQHFMQGQMRTLEQIQAGSQPDPEPEEPVEEPSEPQEEPQETEDNSHMIELEQRSVATSQALRLVLADCMERMTRRETKAVRQAAKHPREFIARIETFYESHRSFMAQAIEPSLRAWLVSVGRDHETEAANLSERLTSEAREALLELSGTVTADELKGAVEKWLRGRMGKVEVMIGRIDENGIR
jgi:hypothetical protein